MQKAVAQQWIVYAWETATNLAKTGDAANITADLYLDGGGANAVDDTNPAELGGGFYVFDITAVESNGDSIVIVPASSTGGVQVRGVPEAVWTTAGSGATSHYSPDSGVRTFGDNDGGTDADLISHDEVYMDTGENTTDGISVLVSVNASDITETPALLRVTGYYNGSAAHNVAVQLYNYTLAIYETIGTMLNRTSAFDYIFPMTSDNHDTGTGEMKVRFLHNTTTYSGGHVLRLDYILFEKSIAGSSGMASDIAAIKNQTDRLVFSVPGNELNARIGSLETGLVVTDGSNTIISFKTDLFSATDNYCVGSFIKFTSGTLVNQTRKISGYGGTSKFIQVSSGFTDIPSAADEFLIINQ